MEGEQEGGREVEEKGSRRRKARTMTKPATTIGVAEEAAIASVGDNRACSNGRGRKDECGSGMGIRTRGRTECRGPSEKRSFCYGSRPG